MTDVDRYEVQLVTDLRNLDALEVWEWQLESWSDRGVVMVYRIQNGEWRTQHYYRYNELQRRNTTIHGEMKDEEEWHVDLECLAKDVLEQGLFNCKVRSGGHVLEARLRFDSVGDMQSFAAELENRGYDPSTENTEYGAPILEVSRPLTGD